MPRQASCGRVAYKAKFGQNSGELCFVDLSRKASLQEKLVRVGALQRGGGGDVEVGGLRPVRRGQVYEVLFKLHQIGICRGVYIM